MAVVSARAAGSPGRGAAPAAVVLALLTVRGRYALQHRDDRPDIASAGRWGLFGGSVDGDETPSAAVRREVHEELAVDVADWQELWRIRYHDPFWDEEVLHIVFAADVTDLWDRHVLREGQATGLFVVDDLPRPMDPFVMALLERHHSACR